MSITITRKITPAMATIIALAACGGGGEETSSTSGDDMKKTDDTAMTEPAPSTPPDNRNLGQLLHDGETLKARNIAALKHDHQGGKVELIDPVDFTIRRTDAGEYVVTLGDVTHTFTRAERVSPHRAMTGNDSLDFRFSVYGGTRRDFHENVDNASTAVWGGFATIWEASRDYEEIDGTDPELRAFGIFGNPTTDFTRLNDMTATYTGGWAWLPLYTASFEGRDFNWDEDRLKLYTDGDDVAFTANFTDGTLSGRLTGFREWDDGQPTAEDPFDLTLTMPPTPFGKDAIQGRFTVSGEDVSDTVANYDASFWGPDANHLDGTISISGTNVDKGTPFVGTGHFSVGKDE